MSKGIVLTDNGMTELVQAIVAKYSGKRVYDGEIKVSSSLTRDRKAHLVFDQIAWMKMWFLVHEWEKEVGWHGIVERTDREDVDEYVVHDIVIPPQKSNGAYVETDEEKYPAWLMTLTDEQANGLHLHGHSHVNMGVTPSGQDTNNWTEILDACGQDSFYVFMILNKKAEKTIRIYDFKKNVSFETADIEVSVNNDLLHLQRFLDDSRTMVGEYVYARKPENSAYVWKGTSGASAYSGISTYSQQNGDDDDDAIYSDVLARQEAGSRYNGKKRWANTALSGRDEDYWRSLGYFGGRK